MYIHGHRYVYINYLLFLNIKLYICNIISILSIYIATSVGFEYSLTAYLNTQSNTDVFSKESIK